MNDVLICGGGPAGAALAILLGRRGLNVELIEQSTFPRDKPCGEGILPPGVEVLRAIGLNGPELGRRLTGVRYHVGDYTVRGGFDDDEQQRFGIGQRRRILDQALFRAASETGGVCVRSGTKVERIVLDGGKAVGVVAGGEERRARWIVGADGASSTLRRLLGLEQIKKPRRVGVRVHFSDLADDELNDIQVFLRPGYELYVTPLPERQLLVAALTGAENATQLRRKFWTWCSQEPMLRGWLRGARPASSLCGRTDLKRTLRPGPMPQGLTFIGDAAASSDPITAGGISAALSDAQRLAEMMPEMLQGSRIAQKRFKREQRGTIGMHRLLGGGLLALSERPRAAEQACRMLARCPTVMDALVKMVAQ